MIFFVLTRWIINEFEKYWASMKVRFSTFATRGFLFLPARRFDQRFASQISKWKKIILKESLWDQVTWVWSSHEMAERESICLVQTDDKFCLIHRLCELAPYYGTHEGALSSFLRLPLTCKQSLFDLPRKIGKRKETGRGLHFLWSTDHPKT